MIYYMRLAQSDGKVGMMRYEGVTLAEIDSILPSTFPGCTWEQVDQATYAAWMKENGPKI